MSELPLSLALAKLAEAAEAIREVATPRGEVYQGAAAAAPPASRDKVFDQRYAAIQTKLDKVIRQLDALSENQAKMAKMLQGLVKAQQLKKDENKKAAEASTNGETKTESEARSAITEQRPDHRSNWARNMFVIGDNHWHCLREVPDIQDQLETLKREVNMRIWPRVEYDLTGLYDEATGKLLFALPPKVDKVALSVGTKDLMTESSLMTLKDASLVEVRRNNERFLRRRAKSMVALARALLALGKTVILLLPPAAEGRHEVFDHWADLMLEETASLQGERLKILNMPKAMLSSRADFASRKEFLTMWFSSDQDEFKTRLSPYGCRRLFDLLSRATTTSSKRRIRDLSCLRCLRSHRSVPCKSIDMACRRCGKVGHFAEVHEVTELATRDLICQELGENIFAAGSDDGFRLLKRPVSPEQESIRQKLIRLSNNEESPSVASLQDLDDWYTTK